MAVATKYITVELIPQTCCDCGIVFGLPDGLAAQRLKDGKMFWCPVGHSQHFTRKRTLEQELSGVRDDLAAQRQAMANERRSHTATKGHLTRTKRRANAGVCLDCHRSFANVRRHRERVHPEGDEA